MSNRWYYLREGEHFGPFAWEQLRQLADAGVLVPGDLVSRPGDPRWVPISEVEGTRGGPPAPNADEGQAGASAGPDPPARPRLWSPNAAVNWSLLFTPVFGALLHAANWRALGRQDKARANARWAWAAAACYAAGLAGIWVPELGPMAAGAGLLVLLAWYALQGRSQALRVGRLAGGYDRRAWTPPLAAAALSVAAYAAVWALLAGPEPPPPPEAVAGEVRPLILAEWAGRPGGANAAIRGITLAPTSPGEYSGTVEAAVDGREARFRLDVSVGGGQIRWRLKPEGQPKPDR